MLEEHLGREVVALVVHEAQDERERHRLDRRERNRGGVGGAGERTARDGDAGSQERRPEREGGRERGLTRRMALVAAAVDRQRGKSGRLVEEEVRLPARTHALGVEERLVPDHVPGHASDPLGAELRRQREQVERGQGRVAVALEHDVAAPERPLELALSEDVGREAEARPECEQRRVRDCELLVRGGDQREAQVPRVDRPSGREVDRQRGRPRLGHVRNGKGPRELARERRLARGGGRRRREQEDRESDGRESGHRDIVETRSASRQGSRTRGAPRWVARPIALGQSACK